MCIVEGPCPLFDFLIWMGCKEGLVGFPSAFCFALLGPLAYFMYAFRMPLGCFSFSF